MWIVLWKMQYNLLFQEFPIIPRNSTLSFLNAERYYQLGIWKHYSGSLTSKCFKEADHFLSNKIYFGNRWYKRDQNKTLAEKDKRLRRGDSVLNLATKLLSDLGPITLVCLSLSFLICKLHLIQFSWAPRLVVGDEAAEELCNLGHLVEFYL